MIACVAASKISTTNVVGMSLRIIPAFCPSSISVAKITMNQLPASSLH